jgi:hypothetical protein
MVLDLSNNPITDAVLDSLVQLLEKNDKIMKIEITGTKISKFNARKKLGKLSTRVLI